MKKWNSTQCCGTCALWNRERATDAIGRVKAHAVAECKWSGQILLPASMNKVQMGRSWMARDYGTDCQCWVKRTAEGKADVPFGQPVTCKCYEWVPDGDKCARCQLPLSVGE